MRDCPNCSEQIQDEAVYCRHCHTELEQPLWLTSMRKCPYCAEWIENDLERCKYCDRTLVADGAPHAAPFVDVSSTPDDLTQSLRLNLLDDDSDEAAAIAAAAEEFIAEEPIASFTNFDPEAFDELPKSAPDDAELGSFASEEPPSDHPRSLYEEPQADLSASIYDEPQSDLRRSLYDEPQADLPTSAYDEPQSDLRRSLYDEPVEDDSTEEPSTYLEPTHEDLSYVEPPPAVDASADSSLWMAGADPAEQAGTGPLAGAGDDLAARSTAGTEGVSELREDASGPQGRVGRAAGRMARTVVIVGVLGAAIWGSVRLYQGPAGAFVAELLATDVPTITPIPQPTSTRRPAPTLPPENEVSPVGTAIVGTPSAGSECVSWDTLALEDEGAQACVYGVIKRWWAGEEIPFIAIFSEEVGTFAIIDRTTRYPVGPGNCILARGTVEIMGGTRPNIDAQGELETCPEGLVEG